MFTLGRKVSLTYRTNQIILSLALISGIMWYIVTTDLAESAVLAGSLFLSWALVREIDCRREYAAFVAVGIYTVLQLFFSLIDKKKEDVLIKASPLFTMFTLNHESCHTSESTMSGKRALKPSPNSDG